MAFQKAPGETNGTEQPMEVDLINFDDEVSIPGQPQMSEDATPPMGTANQMQNAYSQNYQHNDTADHLSPKLETEARQQITSEQTLPKQIVPHQRMHEQMTPQQLLVLQNMSQPIIPQQVMPQEMMPQQMMPQQMMPQQMMPQQVMPQHIIPHQMMPHHVMPQQMIPQQMTPQQMIVPQLMAQRMAQPVQPWQPSHFYMQPERIFNQHMEPLQSTSHHKSHNSVSSDIQGAPEHYRNKYDQTKQEQYQDPNGIRNQSNAAGASHGQTSAYFPISSPGGHEERNDGNNANQGDVGRNQAASNQGGLARVSSTEQYRQGQANNDNNNGKTSNQCSESKNGVSKHPQYTIISGDLADRLEKHPKYYAAPIYWKVKSGGLGNKPGQDNSYWKWSDNSFVRMPHSPLNTIRGGTGTAWDMISIELLKLKAACHRGSLSSSVDVVMASVVRNYMPAASKLSNFGMLNRKDLANDLMQTIPIIIDYALNLPALLGSPLPRLRCGESQTIFMSRKLCCSLLANAFFCTFPESAGQGSSRMPDYNFIKLYNDTHTDRCEVKKEKIKCILNYFKQFLSTEEKFQHQIVSFERRCLKNRVDWASSNKKLCDVGVDVKGRIEDADGMLQCDFANRVIGGGVLNDGSVMEEIRFCISPELIVSRLFTETMDDDEVMTVTGSQLYSEYIGYSTTFKFKGPKAQIHSSKTDSLGRTYTQLVAMDALSFKKHDAHKQYRQDNIDRELHKCHVAFFHGRHVTPVATGNWGCGAFNGNTELKFLIQWMAATQQERGKLQYHTAGDNQQARDINDMSNYLIKKKIDAGQLYKLILKFKGDNANDSIFKHIRNNVERSGGILEGFKNKFTK